ncbi:MAG: ion transporter [Sciscionella sp.]
MSSDTTRRIEHRIGRLDWLMMLLAVFSVGMLVYVTFWRVSAETQYTVFLIDISICGIFLIEFLWRWRRGGWRRAFLLRNWYEILGMIPVSHPAFRGFRLLRVVRLVVGVMRLGGAADRAFGEYFTYQLVTRFSNAVVDAIKRPVTVAVLDEVAAVLHAGRYTQNIARAVRENRTEIRQMVVEKLRQDPQTGRLKALPFHDEIISAVTDTALRVIMEVLVDDRTDELVADAIRENVEQIKLAVGENLYPQDDGRGQPDGPAAQPATTSGWG